MNAQPFRPRDGDYVMNFPQERPGDKQTARDVMKRNGCKAIRFQLDRGTLIAHGYIGRIEGAEVEEL